MNFLETLNLAEQAAEIATQQLREAYLDANSRNANFARETLFLLIDESLNLQKRINKARICAENEAKTCK